MEIDPEIQQLATQIAASSDEVRALLNATKASTGPEVLAGGRFAESLDEVIDVGQRDLRSLADRIEDLADEIRQLGQDAADAATAAATA